MGTIAVISSAPSSITVHPHGRGDNVRWRLLDITRAGSPPRAWGQYWHASRTAHDWRFTPTGVGTMSRAMMMARNGAVHPHGRGDNDRLTAKLDRVVGSPPRAWGQSRYARCAVPVLRFTPTGVGTIAQGGVGVITPPVHPHGRGDNGLGGGRPVPVYGSPPRAWGQCAVQLFNSATSRFTPTGVGTILLIART